VARSVLVDTGYLIALLDPRDNLNARAMEVAQLLARDNPGPDYAAPDVIYQD
jgi:predicted nucleic acid-binding protein